MKTVENKPANDTTNAQRERNETEIINISFVWFDRR